MINKNIIKTLLLIVIIFSIGFVLRVETTSLPGVSTVDKAYYEDDNGLPYMYELDSYYNYRLTNNLLEHGYIGDTLVNGRQWDTYSYYPPGVPLDYPPLIAYLGVLFYKVVNIFGTVPLIVTCFWLPALIGPLAGVVAYLFLRRFTNEYGALTAGILMSLAPYYLIRTVPGWYDTDMFNVIFPLLVVWFFIEAVQSNNARNRTGFTILAISSMVLFSLAWNGWQYMFYLIVIFSLIYFIWCKIKGRKVKNEFFVLGSFTILTLLFAVIFGGYLSLINLIFSPLELLTSQSVWAPFPYVYVMVSELTKPTIEQVISNVGISLFGGLLGFILIYKILIKENLKDKILNKVTWFFYTFLLIWTVTSIFTLFSGGRFIIMLIPPLVISTGLLVGLLVDYMNLIEKQKVQIKGHFKSYNKIISQNKFLLSILLLILILFPAIVNAYSMDSSLIPLVNDDLNSATLWINNSSNVSNDTVIITAWTWGHFYTALADRSIVFDGRLGYIETLSKRNFDNAYPYGENSPSVSREYWIDEAFSTNNQTLSAGIFRMLATSGDSGYLFLNGYTKNTTKSVDILNSILGVDKQTALNILRNNYGFNNDQAQNILSYSHPDNPKPYILITNNGMVTKGYWIFHFGIGWDINKQEGKDITYTVGQMYSSGDIFKSNNGVIYNAHTGNVSWNNKTPYCVLIVRNNSTEKTVLNENSDFSIILLMDTNQSIVVDKGFEDSLFTKLVMEKTNTSQFQSIYRNRNVTIWKVTG